MNKHILILTLSFALSSCQNKTGEIITELDSYGKPLRTTQYINSKEYMELQKVQASEASNQAYFQSQQFKYARVAPEDVALLAAIEGLSDNKNPTNYNDALIYQQQSSVQKHQTWAGFGKSVVTGTIAGIGIVKTADVLKSAMSQGGVTVNGDNNEVRGTNTGENGNATYTNNEPVTNTTTTSSNEEISSLASQCEALGGTFVVDEDRCSDGEGGTIDLTTTTETTTNEIETDTTNIETETNSI